jgi:hypothetical protein
MNLDDNTSCGTTFVDRERPDTEPECQNSSTSVPDRSHCLSNHRDHRDHHDKHRLCRVDLPYVIDRCHSLDDHNHFHLDSDYGLVDPHTGCSFDTGRRSQLRSSGPGRHHSWEAAVAVQKNAPVVEAVPSSGIELQDVVVEAQNQEVGMQAEHSHYGA